MRWTRAFALGSWCLHRGITIDRGGRRVVQGQERPEACLATLLAGVHAEGVVATQGVDNDGQRWVLCDARVIAQPVVDEGIESGGLTGVGIGTFLFGTQGVAERFDGVAEQQRIRRFLHKRTLPWPPVPVSLRCLDSFGWS